MKKCRRGAEEKTTQLTLIIIKLSDRSLDIKTVNIIPGLYRYNLGRCDQCAVKLHSKDTKIIQRVIEYPEFEGTHKDY